VTTKVTGTALTVRQQRFVEEYLVDFIGVRAVERAGYSIRSAPGILTNLMQNPKILAALSERVAKFTEDADVATKDVIDALCKVAFYDIRDAVVWGLDTVVLLPSDLLTDEVAFAVQSVKQTKDGLEIKFHSRMQALDMLGKYLNLFIQKHEVTGPDGGPVEVSPIPIDRLSLDTRRRIVAELEGAVNADGTVDGEYEEVDE